MNQDSVLERLSFLQPACLPACISCIAYSILKRRRGIGQGGNVEWEGNVSIAMFILLAFSTFAWRG
jgi:hypothetical protein